MLLPRSVTIKLNLIGSINKQKQIFYEFSAFGRQLTVALRKCARQITLAQRARFSVQNEFVQLAWAESPLSIDYRREHEPYVSADFNHNFYDMAKINVIPRHTNYEFSIAFRSAAVCVALGVW